eukprot:SAG31_NODE_48_length_30945_cov_16.254263_31_plen_86_part_00
MFIQEEPPEFGRAEVRAAARMANNYRARKARRELASKRAEKKAKDEEAAVEAAYQLKLSDSIIYLQARYRGLKTRRCVQKHCSGP